MKGLIVNFRRGRTTQHQSQMLIQIEGIVSSEKAKTLIGKNVAWKTTSGKEIKGKVLATHGRSGMIRAKFDTGMPGQSLGKYVEIA